MSFSPLFKLFVVAYSLTSCFQKFNLIKKRISKIALEEIELLKTTFFSYDKKIERFLATEIYELKQLKDRIFSDWKNYNEILEKVQGPINKRNFLAHAGFERNAVEIKQKNHKIQLRYSPKLLKTITKIASEI